MEKNTGSSHIPTPEIHVHQYTPEERRIHVRRAYRYSRELMPFVVTAIKEGDPAQKIKAQQTFKEIVHLLYTAAFGHDQWYAQKRADLEKHRRTRPVNVSKRY